MKVAAIYTLPFHRWILADTVAALRALGVEVVEFEHVPRGPHHWAQNDRDFVRSIARERPLPDVLLMADYPYDPFVIATGATVYATRHSLAARGNTYAPEQGTAHRIATWGRPDRRLLAEWLGTLEDDEHFLDVGCPWAGPLLTGTYAPRSIAKDRTRDEDRRPVIAWCPTWNDWSPDVAHELLGIEGVRVVYRPHYATAWRAPQMLKRAADLGFEIDDPLAHPAGLLLRADVLVTDVSGIGLLALAVPDAALPVVQVEPNVEAGPQIERWGPEWTYRSMIGDRVEPSGVREAVERLLLGEDLEIENETLNRRLARRAIFGDDPLPGGLTPGERLARAIVEGGP